MPGILQRIRSVGRAAVNLLAWRFRSSPIALPERKYDGSRLGAFALPTRVEWYLGDISSAMRSADSGNLRPACQLYEAFRIDGRTQGLLSTRTNGLLALPRVITGSRGDSDLVRKLRAKFDSFAASSELAAMLRDLVVLGVCIGEIVGFGASMRLVRLLPEHLNIRVSTGEIVYNGETVCPGNGRWVYFTSSEITPWRCGIWTSLARAFIAKDHAFFLREGYSNKLANPAIVAEAPTGATERDFQDFFSQADAWGPNSTYALRPGYSLKIVETNGSGFEVFRSTMEDSDKDLTVAICGQMLTTDGAKGFVNMGIFQAIRNDLINSDMLVLCTGLDAQVLPWWQQENAVSFEEHCETLSIRFDTESPETKKARLETKRAAIEIAQAARAAGIEDAEILREAGLVSAPSNATSTAPIFAYHLQAGIVKPNEVRATLGLPPVDGGDELMLAGPAAANDAEPAMNAEPISAVQLASVADTGPDEPQDNAAADLAAKMTLHGVARCEHDGVNRCRLCGIERVRDFTAGADGIAVWNVAWRPIVRQQLIAEAAQ